MTAGAQAVARALALNLVLYLVFAALAMLLAYPVGAGAAAGFLALGGVLGWGVAFGAARLMRIGAPRSLRAITATSVLGAAAAGVFLAPDAVFDFSAHRVAGLLVSPGGFLLHLAAFLVVIGAGAWVFMCIAGRAEALSAERHNP